MKEFDVAALMNWSLGLLEKILDNIKPQFQNNDLFNCFYFQIINPSG